MTNVPQATVAERSSGKRAGSKAADRRSVAAGTRDGAKPASRGRAAGGSTGPASRVAQVRLQADELAALQKVMRQLHLTSTSEALREGIRLLVREAAEIGAAEDIRDFYGEQPAPLPEGVVPATERELAAVDAEQW